MQQPNEETLRRRLAEHSPRTIWLERERPMAVLLPLIEGPEGWQVLFEVRAAGISQPGEVCFPGGRVEPGETPEEAAARECREELCLAPKQVELLGAGDRIATPGGVLVHSFAGALRGYTGGFSKSEVAQVFTVPLAWLKRQPPLVRDVPVVTAPGADFPFEKIPGGAAYPWRGGTYRVLFYEYEGRVIWGITAKVLHRMLPLL